VDKLEMRLPEGPNPAPKFDLKWLMLLHDRYSYLT
jgi:hypothetical protein